MFPVLKHKWRGLAALIGLALLISAGILTAGGQFDPSTGSDWVSVSIADLQHRLNASNNPIEQALLSDKINRLNHIQQARQQAGIQALPPQAEAEDICSALAQSLETPTTRQEGILVLEEHDFEDVGLIADNGWQGWVDDNWVRVLAGRSISNNGGLLLIFTENAAFQSVHLTAAAPLRIEDANGSRLTLRDRDGAAYFFDVAARQFLNSPDEVAPSLPPLPTFTPQPNFCP